jgi:hypothetical protein
MNNDICMEIKEPNFFGKLSETELIDFEQVNNIKLPVEYKQFLLNFNGGVPEPNRNLKPDTFVTYILGMHNGPFHTSLYKHIDMLKERLPLSTFPIGTDPFGNLFIMTLHPESYGQIYFWDHEEEPKIQDGHFTQNCYFVANSFSEFVNNLVR